MFWSKKERETEKDAWERGTEISVFVRSVNSVRDMWVREIEIKWVKCMVTNFHSFPTLSKSKTSE